MSNELKQSILSAEQAFQKQLLNAKTVAELEEVRIAFLGRNGSVAHLMESLKTLSLDEKREMGPLLNALKTTLQEHFNARKSELELAHQAQQFAHFKTFDVTAYKQPKTSGSLHVFTKIIEELEDIFISMGFEQVYGPEVDTEFYNFEALNIPATHPARATHDTFWLTTPGLLLRTHTSTMQIHAMEKQRPPLAIFAPGRCFRNEATDATHDFMFMQYECLLVDKKISIAHLIATSQTFLRALFNDSSIKIRVRPGYFPFVEPGLEIDASCPFCTNGCSVCKRTRWIELLGSGLVHPNVLRSVGIDPEVYSGFAFGGGLERLAMIKYGITDIRLLRNSPLHFLQQWT